MRTAYEKESGDMFSDASDIAIRLKVLAGELYKTQTNIEWLKKQMFSVSAQGEYLDYLASQRGLERKQAFKSKGKLDFSISVPVDYDILIPKGSVVATDDKTPVRFVTTENATITSGNLTVSVAAEAEKSGLSGNAVRNKVIVGVNIPSGIGKVTNSVAFTGGADVESDDELRARIKKTYVNAANGTNAAYYEQLAMSVDGVAKVGAVGKVRGSGSVNVYVSGKTGAVSDKVLQTVQKLLDSERELNVNVLAANAQRTSCNLSVIVYPRSGYSTDEVKKLIKSAFESYVYSLPVGGKFYLSELGTKLLETGCVSNYTWNTTMTDIQAAKSQCFVPGTVTIEVK